MTEPEDRADATPGTSAAPRPSPTSRAPASSAQSARPRPSPSSAPGRPRPGKAAASDPMDAAMKRFLAASEPDQDDDERRAVRARLRRQRAARSTGPATTGADTTATRATATRATATRATSATGVAESRAADKAAESTDTGAQSGSGKTDLTKQREPKPRHRAESAQATKAADPPEADEQTDKQPDKQPDKAPDDQPDNTADGRKKNPALKAPWYRRILGALKPLLILVVVVGVIAVVLRLFVVQPFYIPSESMEPTLHGCMGCSDDRVLVDKVSYHFQDVHAGDVVVFHSNDAIKRVGVDDGVLIKRVIATAGDTLQLRNGVVYINGLALDESYVNSKCPAPVTRPLNGTSSWTIPDGDVFVMGDNRCMSEDSRAFGPIKTSSIIGRAVLKIWPLSRFGRIH